MNNGASSYHRFLDGDESGLVEIVEIYKDNLIFFIYSYVGDLHLAEDLVEDTFLKLIIKRPKYKEEYLFKTWLFKIARNLTLDYLKREKRFLISNLEEDKSYLEEQALFIEDLIKEEEKKLLHETLEKINSEYREVLHLIYFEYMSNEQVAKILKKNKRQIENLSYRAKRALKTALEKEGFTYEKF